MQRALGKIDGVSRVDVSLSPGSATLEADTTRVTPGQIEAAISSLGYQAKLHSLPPAPIADERTIRHDHDS